MPPQPLPAAAIGADGMQQSASQSFIPTQQQQQYQHHHSDEKQEAPQQQPLPPSLLPYSQSQSYLHLPSSGLHSSSASHAYLSPADHTSTAAGGSPNTSPRRSVPHAGSGSGSSRGSHVSSFSNLHSHAGLEAYMMGVHASRPVQQPQQQQSLSGRSARRTHQTQTPLQPLQVYMSPRKPALHSAQHAQPAPQQQQTAVLESTAGFSPRVGLAVNPAPPPPQQSQQQQQSHRSSGVFLPPVAPTPVSHNGSAAASSSSAVVSPSTVLLTVRGR